MFKHIYRIVLSVVFITILLLPVNNAAIIGWEKPTLISAAYDGNFPLVVKSENYLTCMFVYTTDTYNAIMICVKSNLQTPWSEPMEIQRLSPGPAAPISCCTAPGNTFYLTWEDSSNRIYFSKSTNGPYSWTPRIDIIDTDILGFLPQIFVDNMNRIHIFYHEAKKSVDKFSLYRIYSEDFGITWNTKQAIATEIQQNVRGSFFPAILLLSNQFFLTWQARQGGEEDETLDDELYFIKSDNYGDTWSLPHQIANNLWNDLRPKMIIDPNSKNLYLFWEANREDDYDIYFQEGVALIDGTYQWKIPQLLSDTPTGSHYADCILSSNRINVVWYDYRNGESELYSRTITLSEKTNILGKEHRVTDMSGNIKNPSLISFSNRLFCIFQEIAGSIHTIYYIVKDTDCSAPRITSTTHTSGQPSAEVTAHIIISARDDPSGSTGFAYVVDSYNNTTPDIINAYGNELTLNLKNLSEGIHYVHARAIDGAENWSPTTTFTIIIDLTGPPPPTIYSSTHPTITPSYNRNPIFSFHCDDTISNQGWSYILTTNRNEEPPETLMTTATQAFFTNINPGMYFFKVRALDMLNNWGSAAEKNIQIRLDSTPPAAPFIFSPTHITNIASTNAHPIFQFSASDPISGISGYSYCLCTATNIVPPAKILTTTNTVTLSRVYHGTQWMSARAADGSGNWSPPSYYRIIINTPLSLALYSPTHTNTLPSSNNNVLIEWHPPVGWYCEGFSYVMTKKSDEEPNDFINSTDTTNIWYNNLGNGHYYFKIKVKTIKGGWSASYSLEFNITGVEETAIADTAIFDKDGWIIQERRVGYRVKQGDTLSGIISYVLQLKLFGSHKRYLHAIAQFNNVENFDSIRQNDIIWFPCITVHEDDTAQELAMHYIGSESAVRKMIIIGDKKDTNTLEAGDTIIFRDTGFLSHIHR